jgi:hypothetical protein
VLLLAARSRRKTEVAAAAPRVTVLIALRTIPISLTPDRVASAADDLLLGRVYQARRLKAAGLSVSAQMSIPSRRLQVRTWLF